MNGIVVVTGAAGFVGRCLARQCSDAGYIVRTCVRKKSSSNMNVGDTVEVGDIGPSTHWTPALVGVETVIHLAARAHVMKEISYDPLALFRCVNTQGTLHLARMAAEAGVKRFIYISSIGVNGARTTGKPFTEEDPPLPHDFYAISKYEAELGLWRLSRDTDLEIVVIRPPLVYGPGAPGNMGRLLRLINSGFPLPFASIHNRRSLISVDNLVDFIVTCIGHPKASNQSFLVSDGEDISTTELLKKAAKAMGKRIFLLPVPLGMMRFVAKLLRKEKVTYRLFDSLQVDILKARSLLGWTPPFSVDEGLRRMVQDSSTTVQID